MLAINPLRNTFKSINDVIHHSLACIITLCKVHRNEIECICKIGATKFKTWVKYCTKNRCSKIKVSLTINYCVMVSFIIGNYLSFAVIMISILNGRRSIGSRTLQSHYVQIKIIWKKLTRQNRIELYTNYSKLFLVIFSWWTQSCSVMNYPRIVPPRDQIPPSTYLSNLDTLRCQLIIIIWGIKFLSLV